ncbi:MAG: hydantoinase/oxoprolinase family protein [Acidimicrobiia bacterium]
MAEGLSGTGVSYRVGVDVGGTFTDLICVTSSGDVRLDKTPSTLDDQSRGVMTGIGQLADHFGESVNDFCAALEVVVHGTTTADNTMIEMNGARTGLLVTEGHRDEIEMRRVHKEMIWDPSYPAPPPIARRRARIPIAERIDHTGTILRPLDEAAVRAGVQRLRLLDVQSIAIMFLFSFVNPSHELLAAEIVREEFPNVEHISMSHEVMARGPEFERVSTTLVNAYVAPKIAGYVGRLEAELRAAGYAGQLLIMQSTGGVMPPSYVSRRAVTLLASGPAGGVMGAALAASRAGVGEFVAVDMGGTSFDLCLVRGGRPEIKTDWNWRYRYYIGLPMVDVQSVGAGGGSIARVRQGALLVGPESAGSDPGPACYSRGGTRPTVTDADAVLGYLPAEGFAGGRMELDVDAARAAIERDVAIPFGTDVTEAAWGIERIVNANMANATRRVLASHGADPRTLALIAYGGNGPVHAWAIARELGVGRVLIPKAAPAFSALGVLVADSVVDLVRSYVTPLAQVDLDRLARLMRDIAGEAEKELEPTGFAATTTEHFVQMCYPGQNFDICVPNPPSITADDLIGLAERFHAQHERDRGFSFTNQPPLIRGVRLVARATTPKPERFAELGAVTDAASVRIGSRDAYFGTEFVETPVYDGSQLSAGIEITGPALVQEPFTVVVVPPGARLTLDPTGNYELHLG